MREGIQTKFKHDELRVYGCYFFTLLQWAEMVHAEELSPEFNAAHKDRTDDGIINVFLACRARGWIGNNSWIINPAEILNYCIGQRRFSKVEKVYKKPDLPIFITSVEKSKDISHFILSNPTQTVLWDCWEPKVDLTKHTVTSYRAIT